jgi:urease accessory protein
LTRLLVARYRGASPEAARMYFVELLRLVRPVLAGRDAVPPRIWNT